MKGITDMTKTQLNQIIGSKPCARHLCGDGAEMLRFNSVIADTYKALCAAYEEQGYTLYCEDPRLGGFLPESRTYVKGDEYAVLFFFRWEYQLHVTISKKGAKKLPDPNMVEGVAAICPMTLTQPKTEQQGMCEIFRLTDGSFLIFDACNYGAHHTIYQTLCKLNGSAENIRVRVWMMTHVHGDHYGGFIDFAKTYANAITLDTVLYAPVNRDVIATIASYKNSWDSIDYFFNDGFADFVKTHFPNTVLCAVHAGQRFKLPGAELRILYTPEHLYIERIPVNMNHGTIVTQVIGEEGKALIMGDSEHCSTYWVIKTHQDALKSDIFQYPHHGSGRVPDLVTTVLSHSRAVLIPCTSAYYERNSNHLTHAVENWEWTEAHYVMGDGTVTLRMNGERVD
ncbi:MAG: hypothetical protein E7666_02765 [Ruminococcaceae bacterium]|nr:hypothetical protein [Oscillospiraceae bacterium]